MIFIFVNGKNVHKTLIILSKLCYCYVYDSLVLVAQWTRARGYEPRCRGFESLLAQEKECCNQKINAFGCFLHYKFIFYD